MKSRYKYIPSLLVLVLLCGCGPIGEKSASMSIVYGATTVLSLLLLVGYCFLVRKKDLWHVLLFASVAVVNIGYLTLSLSGTLKEALLANRVSYLGSVFLPFAMLMIIIQVCQLHYRRWLPLLLLGISLVMFLIAASPGYLDLYYHSVSLTVVNGVTVLNKVYGPLHCLYLYYLLVYFSAMIAVILWATLKRRIASNKFAIILASAVFVNISVWLLEQLVKIDFEFLSVSYIISEVFLLCLRLLLQEPVNASDPAPEVCPIISPSTPPESPLDTSSEFAARCETFAAQIHTLTPTERTIYKLYLEKKTTKEVLVLLNIKENTLKYHNKNIYGKLGVSSRKQLLEFAEALPQKTNAL